MTKVKSNAAEIIIATIATIILMSSCGGNHYTCPSYADTFKWDKYEACDDEQGRQNFVFINY